MKLAVYSAIGRPREVAEFHVIAKRWGDKVFEARRGRDLLDLPDAEHVILVGHGGTSWLFHPRRGIGIQGGDVGVATLAERFAEMGVGKVSLAACLCSRSPRWFLRWKFGRVVSGWGTLGYRPGGLASFSARLRDFVSWYGGYVRVRGHRTAGHASGNPILAEHTGFAGTPCLPLFELALDEKPTRENRRRWVRLVRGRLAERWLMFDDGAIEDIREGWNALS